MARVYAESNMEVQMLPLIVLYKIYTLYWNLFYVVFMCERKINALGLEVGGL